MHEAVLVEHVLTHLAGRTFAHGIFYDSSNWIEIEQSVR